MEVARRELKVKEFVESKGYEIFSSSGKKWKEVDCNKKDMRVLYNGWERWITTIWEQT